MEIVFTLLSLLKGHDKREREWSFHIEIRERCRSHRSGCERQRETQYTASLYTGRPEAHKHSICTHTRLIVSFRKTDGQRE